ncbi:MAG: LuxR C-terminal-related transcriptional regulator [Ornithinibacter sp.]
MRGGLQQADLDRVWALAEEVEHASSVDVVMAITTRSLLDLLTAESISFNWVSKGRAYAIVHPALPTEMMEHFEPILGLRWRENPLAEHMRRTADCRPLRWCDVTDVDRWRGASFYREFYALLGVHDQMAIRVPSHPGVLGALVANSTRDFNERQRTILGLVGGHVAHRLHVLDDRAAQAAGAPGSGWDVVTVDDAGQIISVHGALVARLGVRVGQPLPRELAGLAAGSRERTGTAATGPEGPSRPRGPRIVQSSQGPLVAVAPGWRGSHPLFLRADMTEAADRRNASGLEGIGLTPRQTQVALFLADGESNQRIASRLGISLGTVKKHCHLLYDALEVDNRAAAAASIVRLLGPHGGAHRSG